MSEGGLSPPPVLSISIVVIFKDIERSVDDKRVNKSTRYISISTGYANLEICLHIRRVIIGFCVTG